MIKLILVLPLVTLIHSWYPSACCSDRDCKPVPCEELLELKDGSIEYQSSASPSERSVFHKAQIQPSQDGQCHVCISQGGTPFCVFILQNS